MNAPDLLILLEKLGCRKIKQTPKWLNASCPFAPYSPLHRNGTDSHPSFGVTVSEGRSGYQCFTCNTKGNLSHLLFRLRHLAERYQRDTSYLSDLFAWVQARDKDAPRTAESLKERLKRSAYRERKAVEVGGILVSETTFSKALGTTWEDTARVTESVLDEAELHQFESLSEEAFDYLVQERALTPETIYEWEFRWHPVSRRIAIPIRDCKQRLVGISGRAIDGNTRVKFLHSKGYARDCYLFGENRLVEGGRGAGIVVEGFFDAIYLCQQGYDAVAILGTYPSRIQIEKLIRFFGEIVVLPDGDAAGYEAAKRVVDCIGGRLPTRILPIPHGKDPDELSALELAELLGEVPRLLPQEVAL